MRDATYVVVAPLPLLPFFLPVFVPLVDVLLEIVAGPAGANIFFKQSDFFQHRFEIQSQCALCKALG